MSNTWYRSDEHFLHKSQAARRGFNSVEEHDEFLIDNHNSYVKPDDTVWFLGDLSMERKVSKIAHLIERMNGIKNWVPGNHDSTHPMKRGFLSELKQSQGLFNFVGSHASFRAEGTTILLNHFPYAGMPGSDHTDEDRYVQWRFPNSGLFLLHGHTHQEELHVSFNSLHVGWEAWKRPVPHEEAMQHFLAWKKST